MKKGVWTGTRGVGPGKGKTLSCHAPKTPLLSRRRQVVFCAEVADADRWQLEVVDRTDLLPTQRRHDGLTRHGRTTKVRQFVTLEDIQHLQVERIGECPCGLVIDLVGLVTTFDAVDGSNADAGEFRQFLHGKPKAMPYTPQLVRQCDHLFRWIGTTSGLMYELHYNITGLKSQLT